jgi:hypothetical protein
MTVYHDTESLLVGALNPSMVNGMRWPTGMGRWKSSAAWTRWKMARSCGFRTG